MKKKLYAPTVIVVLLVIVALLYATGNPFVTNLFSNPQTASTTSVVSVPVVQVPVLDSAALCEDECEEAAFDSCYFDTIAPSVVSESFSNSIEKEKPLTKKEIASTNLLIIQHDRQMVSEKPTGDSLVRQEIEDMYFTPMKAVYKATDNPFLKAIYDTLTHAEFGRAEILDTLYPDSYRGLKVLLRCDDNPTVTNSYIGIQHAVVLEDPYAFSEPYRAFLGFRVRKYLLTDPGYDTTLYFLPEGKIGFADRKVLNILSNNYWPVFAGTFENFHVNGQDDAFWEIFKEDMGIPIDYSLSKEEIVFWQSLIEYDAIISAFIPPTPHGEK
jgi:hypothetical protein